MNPSTKYKPKFTDTKNTYTYIPTHDTIIITFKRIRNCTKREKTELASIPSYIQELYNKRQKEDKRRGKNKHNTSKDSCLRKSKQNMLLVRTSRSVTCKTHFRAYPYSAATRIRTATTPLKITWTEPRIIK